MFARVVCFAAVSKTAAAKRLVPAHGLGSGDVASSRDVLGARYVREMQFQGIVGLHGRVRLSFIRPQNLIRGDTGQNQLVLGS